MTNELSGLRREYNFSTLDEKNVSDGPMAQFTIWMKEAIGAEIVEPNAMVLSTAGKDGSVSARIVLLKGTDHEGFVFFSNYLSRKGLQLAANPKAALTFHWHLPARQVRVEGKVTKISRRESVDYFNSRPLESRISACVSPQSSVIPDRAFLEAMRDGFMLDLGDSSPVCPESWGGYRLRPTSVEFWQGRTGRLHDRLRYSRKNKKWVVERLAP